MMPTATIPNGIEFMTSHTIDFIIPETFITIFQTFDYQAIILGE